MKTYRLIFEGYEKVIQANSLLLAVQKCCFDDYQAKLLMVIDLEYEKEMTQRIKEMKIGL